jgi:hypothetical protein
MADVQVLIIAQRLSASLILSHRGQAVLQSRLLVLNAFRHHLSHRGQAVLQSRLLVLNAFRHH